MFAKAPEPGKVKTRLGRTIGDVAAAKLHEAFVLDMAQTMQTFRQEQPNADDIQLCLAWSGRRGHRCFEALAGMGFELIEQPEGDLGARLERVSAQAFERGARRVLITGSDSPTLLARHYDASFELLNASEPTVVFGPSFDGGYYMVGLNAPTSCAFDDIPWSQPDTLRVSVARVRAQQGHCCWLTEFWYDVDTIEDLEHMERHLSYLRGVQGLKGLFSHTNAQLTSMVRDDKNA